MKQREALLVLAAVVLAVGVSASLLASSLASTQSASSQRPGIFFSPRNSPPPARSVIEAQRDLPAPLQPILPVQRGLTDTARDAAGYLLILLGTSARSEEHTSELQSRVDLVCRLLLEKKKLRRREPGEG